MQVVVDNAHLLWRGLKLTLELSAVVIFLATILGTFIGVGLLYGNLVVRTLFRIYVDVMRGTPLLVVIFLIAYGVDRLNINIFDHQVNTSFSRFQTAALAFTFFSSAHVGEIIRGAIGAISKGQTDAAKAIGLTFWKRLIYVLLPQSLPVILPPWTNTAAEIIKGTTLITLVAMSDLLFEIQKVSARTGEFLPLYLAGALTYFIICFTISRSGAMLSRRFRFGVAN